MKKLIPRVTLVGASLLCLSLVSAPLAAAASSEHGNKTCGTQYYVASKSKGKGVVYAQVGSLIVANDHNYVYSVYNTDQDFLRTNVYWETGAETSYSASFSGPYCNHV